MPVSCAATTPYPDLFPTGVLPDGHSNVTPYAPWQVLNKAGPSGEANVLSVAPTAARFSYLPISTPSATAAGLRRLPATGIAQPGTVSSLSSSFSLLQQICRDMTPPPYLD